MRLIGAALLILSIGACDQPAPLAPGAVAPAANQAPQISTGVVSPALGIDDVTTFTVRVEVRDPDGDPVSLSVSGCSFGDNAPVPLENGVATLSFKASRLCPSSLALRAVDARGLAELATIPFQHTRFSSWYRLVIGDGFYDQPYFFVSLEQTGSTITGTIRDSRNHTGTVDPHEPGTIDADGRFRVRFKIQSEEDTEISGRIVSAEINLGRDVVVATGVVTSNRFSGQTFKIWREAQY